MNNVMRSFKMMGRMGKCLYQSLTQIENLENPIFCLLYLPISEMNIIKDSKGCDSALMNVIQIFLCANGWESFRKGNMVFSPVSKRLKL